MNLSPRTWKTARNIGLGVALLGSLTLLAWTSASALGWTSGEEDRITVRGTLKLTSGAFSTQGDQCSSTRGYTDIAPGAPVVIHDASGEVVAMGSLQAGRAADLFEAGEQQLAAACAFEFEVADVPSGAVYGVQVSHRGTVTFSDDQVMLGQVTLTLGS